MHAESHRGAFDTPQHYERRRARRYSPCATRLEHGLLRILATDAGGVTNTPPDLISTAPPQFRPVPVAHDSRLAQPATLENARRRVQTGICGLGPSRETAAAGSTSLADRPRAPLAQSLVRRPE